MPGSPQKRYVESKLCGRHLLAKPRNSSQPTAPGSAPGGRRFKSSLPDQFKTKPLTRVSLLCELLRQGQLLQGTLCLIISISFCIRFVRVAAEGHAARASQRDHYRAALCEVGKGTARPARRACQCDVEWSI